MAGCIVSSAIVRRAQGLEELVLSTERYRRLVICVGGVCVADYYCFQQGMEIWGSLRRC